MFTAKRSKDSKKKSSPELRYAHFNYYDTRADFGPLTGTNFLEPIDSAKRDKVHKDMQKTVSDVASVCMPTEDVGRLQNMVDKKNKNIFRSSLSRGFAAILEPLKIALTSEACPIHVYLCQYCNDQHEIPSGMMNKLVQCDTVYSNLTAALASATYPVVA